ncbi:DUF6233 domain-containing protein [Streptomyces sp. NPDC002386]
MRRGRNRCRKPGGASLRPACDALVQAAGRPFKHPRSGRPGSWWRLHAGHPLGADCTVIQSEANPISADDGCQALTGDGMYFHVCEFCRPDAHLGFPVGSGGRAGVARWPRAALAGGATRCWSPVSARACQPGCDNL